MGLNKQTMVKQAGVVLFLIMAFTAATVEAGRGLDPSTLLAQAALMNVEPNFITKSTTTACCDKCFCRESEPPQCQCRDVGETCHSACKLCICALSYPPQCHCLDTTTFCYVKCSSIDSAKPVNRSPSIML